MKKTLATLGILAVLCGCLVACGSGGQAKKPEVLLAGKWRAAQSGGSTFFSIDLDSFEFVPSAADPLRGTVNLGKLASLVTDGSYEVIPARDKGGRDMLIISTKTLRVFNRTSSYFFTVNETTLALQPVDSEPTKDPDDPEATEAPADIITFIRNAGEAGTTG